MGNEEDCPETPVLSFTERNTVVPINLESTTQVNGEAADGPRLSRALFGGESERILNCHGPIPPCQENWTGLQAVALVGALTVKAKESGIRSASTTMQWAYIAEGEEGEQNWSRWDDL
jgi:hypothetical protein